MQITRKEEIDFYWLRRTVQPNLGKQIRITDNDPRIESQSKLGIAFSKSSIGMISLNS